MRWWQEAEKAGTLDCSQLEAPSREWVRAQAADSSDHRSACQHLSYSTICESRRLLGSAYCHCSPLCAASQPQRASRSRNCSGTTLCTTALLIYDFLIFPTPLSTRSFAQSLRSTFLCTRSHWLAACETLTLYRGHATHDLPTSSLRILVWNTTFSQPPNPFRDALMS